MATYQRSVRVDAPLSDVWEFHSTVDGLTALTPGWMGLRVESVRGSDGDPDPEVLEAGTELRLSLRPFGLGPRQRWVTRITRREEGEGTATFEDEMTDGPFPEWRHVHQFYADDGGTVVRDVVRYEFPGLGKTGSPLAKVGFEPMFRYRHRRTKELLE